MATNEPAYALQHRFPVDAIGINKARLPAQHESLAIWVSDQKTLKHHKFVIERVPSDRSYASRFTAFSQCPDSKTILTSIEDAVQNMRSNTTCAAEALFVSLGTELEANPEAIPLLPLSNDDPKDPSEMPHPDTLKTTLFYSFTTTLVGAFALARLGSNSFSPQRLAFDSISGVPTDSLKAEQCICYFHPKNLSLFDVVLLARVVHHYAPIYDLFQNQCYIFASVIFNTIVQIYSVPAVTVGTDSSSTAVPAPTPENGVPNNANMIFLPTPDQVGRWSGLLLIDPVVKSSIISVVYRIYMAERKGLMADIMA